MNSPAAPPPCPLVLAPVAPVAGRLRRLFQGLQELCFPTACLVCGKASRLSADFLLCPACANNLEFVRSPCCPGCGIVYPHAAGGDHFCGACLSGAYCFRRARSLVRYEETAAAIIHSLKYGKRRWGLKTIAGLARRAPRLYDLAEPEIIVPVPLFPARLRERGFNQALLLAKAFFPHGAERIRAQTLERRRPTPPQASLGGRARRELIRGAFAVREPEKVRDRQVLLVDDVMTTGATANECAKALRRAGAASVELLTFARVWDE